ncbi:Aryl-alcohol dehydrogenase [Cupriavidus oxalaticus]|uniref:NAD(P)-dependent alcohol dehydrogenase n=1 Tax=Cupriavidus oxalaticus TaxID=96344 RepID=UPI003F73EC0A
MTTETIDTGFTTAAVVKAQGEPFVLRDLQLGPPHEDEVTIELEACGMCRADLAAQAGSIPFPLPGVLGHEGVGRIVAVGAAVRERSVGERVVVSFSACGRCDACLDAAPAYCQAWPPLNLVGGGRGDGSTSLCDHGHAVHSHFFGQSSFSRRIVAAARAVVPVPDDIPAAVLAPLGCGIQTGVSAAVNVLRPRAGDRVAVFGAGAVGLSALMGLGLTGATEIIAIDVHPHRLALARELGATAVIDAAREDVEAALQRLTGGAGVDGAIETSGNPAALKSSIRMLASAGTCVVVGVPAHGEAGQFDVIDVVARGLRIVGTNQGDANPRVMIPRLIELYRSGRLPIERLVTTFAFRDINAAAAASLDGSVIKPVLLMRDA